MLGLRNKSKNKWLVLTTICLSTIVVSLHEIIVLVALPTLRLKYDTESEMAFWFIGSYIISLAGFIFMSGFLADRYGRTKTLISGLAFYLLANLLAQYWVSNNIEFIITQVISGIGGAAILTSGFAILVETFHNNKEELISAISIWIGVSISFLILSILIGGILLTQLGLDSIFIINEIIIIISIFATSLLIKESKYPKGNKFNIIEITLLTITITALTYSIIFFPKYGLFETKILAGILTSAICKSLLFVYIKNTKNSIFPLSYLIEKERLKNIVAIGALFLSISGVIYFISETLMLTKEQDQITAGIIVLPMSFAFLISPSIGRDISKNISNSKITKLSIMLTVVTLLSISLWTFRTDILIMSIILMIFGLVSGIALGILHGDFFDRAPKEKYGTFAGTLLIYRIIPSILAISIIQTVLNTKYAYIMNNNIQGQAPPAIVQNITSSIGGAYTVASQLEISGQIVQSGILKGIAGQAYFSALGSGLVLISIISIICLIYIDSNADIRKKLKL